MNMSQNMLPEDVGGKVYRLLTAAGMGDMSGAIAQMTIEALGGDGSNRRFWRLALQTGQKVIVVAPEKHEEKCLREADAVYHIGTHLRSCEVPVPAIYGYDHEDGIVLCEDLGETHLHSYAIATDWRNSDSVERLRGLYLQTIEILVDMQTRAAEGFNPNWCWDTPRYDRQLMIERESGYFIRAFWQGLLGQEVPTGLTDEFSQLADAAAKIPAVYFLHRDFQSRNVMIHQGRVRVIDFQGARLGPLGYDLASLLLDPYAALPQWFQAELYNHYRDKVAAYVPLAAEDFQHQYQVLALQRNLQILGAFSFLSAVSGKSFFRAYIAPALSSLIQLNEDCRRPHLPILASVAHNAKKLLG